MHCGNCGTEIKEKTNFCPECGEELIEKSANPRFSRPPEKYDGPKKLYRSREDRLITGVCGGLGNYLEIDPNIVRILFILLTLAGGAGILLYLIMTVVIPESPYDPWGEPE